LEIYIWRGVKKKDFGRYLSISSEISGIISNEKTFYVMGSLSADPKRTPKKVEMDPYKWENIPVTCKISQVSGKCPK